MTALTTETVTPDQQRPAPEGTDPSRRIDASRMKSPVAMAALAASAVGAVGMTLGTVVAGKLAEDPTRGLVWLLAICLVGAAVVDTFGKIAWVGCSDRAEGRLREDLLRAALRQPLSALSEQAVGEILDRIDDDSHEVGNLVRWQIWMLARTLFATLPMWVVAGLTWWPSFVLFPVLAGVTWLAIRSLLGEIARRKVVEEMAWTDHAAVLEEGIAGRDDLRTSLGQPHVVRRVARLSADVHAKFKAVVDVESRLVRRAGVLLHALLAGIAVAGVAFASGGSLSVAQLVTLFLVTSTFVGQIAMVANHLPDLQAGLGAVIRLRQMLAVPPEPEGGSPLPEGPLDLELRGLHFSYAEGTFALQGIDLQVPAGQTVALVGRTGSGKSTLAALVSRAMEPPRGTVFLGRTDVRDLDLQRLRRSVGVVTQRTEILAGTLVENITLFAEIPRSTVEAAVAELGLDGWVAGLPAGLDTLLGPGGTSLSAGEEQLVAFARLLVRDVRVVVLDEATARMDPLTERRGGSGRPAARGPDGHPRRPPVVYHRAGPAGRRTRARAHRPAGRPHRARRGARAVPRPAGGKPHRARSRPSRGGRHRRQGRGRGRALRGGPHRRRGAPSLRPAAGDRGRRHGSLPGVRHRARARGASGVGCPGSSPVPGRLPRRRARRRHRAALGTRRRGPPTWREPHVADRRGRGEPARRARPAGQRLLALPQWWVEVMLRARMAVLYGQTSQRRLARTPPGEVVARSMDADRYARYADRWVDFVNGLIIASVTALLAGTWMAGAVLLAVMVASALASTLGRPIAGRSAAASSTARAGFGRALVSALDSARTIKLAAAVPEVHAHLRQVDSGRVAAAVKEHRVQAFLDGVPTVMVQCGVVTAWAIYFSGGWSLAIALLVANAVGGFDWFGRVAGMVVTEAPGTRAWQKETSRFAGGADLMDLPSRVDLVSGDAPEPEPVRRVPLERLELTGFSAVHDDGTIGVSSVDLTVEAGELVLLVGQVGSGKSSLLSALAGLIEHSGVLLWNGREVTDPQAFLRPAQVAHVAQVPRVLSGSFSDNVLLGHRRDFDDPVSAARLARDIDEAGGKDALVGHRGVRLSGGQVQRLALARALAADAELLLADDVSSALDAATEIELWAALRQRRATVIGATAKRAALAQADRVVVLVGGEVAATGPWHELAAAWSHLAG